METNTTDKVPMNAQKNHVPHVTKGNIVSIHTQSKPAELKTINLNPETGAATKPTATRHDLQMGRRLFHMFSGSLGATVYTFYVTRSQAISIVGVIVSILYLLEQIRINYPKLSQQLTFLNRFILRAEERLKESSSVPMAIACLCCILTFPKAAAVIAIFTLGISDPLAAIIGIQFGRHPFLHRKTLEGSAAFGGSVFFISNLVLTHELAGFSLTILGASFVIGILATVFEAIPVKIDDNLTIPLYMGAIVWIVAAISNLPI